jgi:hypothetical protein
MNDKWGRPLVNFFVIVKLSSLALVMSKQLPQDGREENEVVAPKDPEMAPKVERSEEYSHSL